MINNDYRSLYSHTDRQRHGVDVIVMETPEYLITLCVKGMHSGKYILWTEGICRAIGSIEWVRESLERLRNTDEPGHGWGV